MSDKPVDKMSDSELRREIAERIGWHMETNRERVRVVEPNGEPVSPTWHPNADVAWHFAFIPGRVPNWPEDLEAALGLFFQRNYIQIEHHNGQWRVDPNYLTDEDDERWVMPRMGDRLPRLLCEAWVCRQRKIEELRAAGRL